MSLILPGTNRPTNLHLTPDQMRWELDGDTLAWLKNLPLEVEGGDRLYVLIQEQNREPFIIMEKDIRQDDGTYRDQFVLRTDRLDRRTYDRLRRARQIPLMKRLEWAQQENERYEAQHREEEMDELYETLGGPMLRELDRASFLGAPRGESYPKRGPAHRRATAGRRSSGGVLLP